MLILYQWKVLKLNNPEYKRNTSDRTVNYDNNSLLVWKDEANLALTSLKLERW